MAYLCMERYLRLRHFKLVQPSFAFRLRLASLQTTLSAHSLVPLVLCVENGRFCGCFDGLLEDESAWTNADAAEAQMQSREEVHALMQTAQLGQVFPL